MNEFNQISEQISKIWQRFLTFVDSYPKEVSRILKKSYLQWTQERIKVVVSSTEIGIHSEITSTKEENQQQAELIRNERSNVLRQLEVPPVIEEMVGTEKVCGNKKRDDEKKEAREKYLHPVILEEVWKKDERI